MERKVFLRSVLAFIFGFSVSMAVGYVILFVEILLAYQQLETVLQSIVLNYGLSKVGAFVNQTVIITIISMAIGSFSVYLQRRATERLPQP